MRDLSWWLEGLVIPVSPSTQPPSPFTPPPGTAGEEEALFTPSPFTPPPDTACTAMLDMQTLLFDAFEELRAAAAAVGAVGGEVAEAGAAGVGHGGCASRKSEATTRGRGRIRCTSVI